MPPKYDTQVFIGLGVVALLMMGMADSNKTKEAVEDDDAPMDSPPVQLEENTFAVALRHGQELISECDQKVMPSCRELTGNMSLARARETRGGRMEAIDSWRNRAQGWFRAHSEQFALAGYLELVKAFQARLEALDEWFDEMAGKERQPGGGQYYQLNQNAYVQNNEYRAFNQDMELSETDTNSRAQRLDQNDWPEKGKLQPSFDTRTTQRRSGNGLTDSLQRDYSGANFPSDKPTPAAMQLFGDATYTDPQIDFSNQTRDWSQLVTNNRDSPNDIYMDSRNEGVQMPVGASFNVDNNPTLDDNDDPPSFAGDKPTRESKPPAIVPKPVAVEKLPVIHAKSVEDMIENLGSLEAIMENHPGTGLPADVDGTGAVEILDRLPTAIPASQTVEQFVYPQTAPDGRVLPSVTRDQVEHELTVRLRKLVVPFLTWDEGMGIYRQGISDLREIEALIGQNRGGAGQKFSSRDVSDMISQFQEALTALNKSGMEQFVGSDGRPSFSKAYKGERGATRVEREGKRRKAGDPFFGTSQLSTTNQAILARVLKEPQKDFTGGV